MPRHQHGEHQTCESCRTRTAASRTRAKAQWLALRDLRAKHPDDYAALYQRHRAELAADQDGAAA